jgi:hypothetical protein
MPDGNATFGVAQIVTLALGSGVVSAFVNQGMTALISRGAYKKDAAFTALRAAIELEAYVGQAADTLADWKNVSYFDIQVEREEEREQSRAGFPRFEGFDERLDWRHVAPKLSARALTFANETKAAGNWVSGHFEFDDDDGIREMQLQAAHRGQRAIALARDLRAHYELPAFTTKDFPWDYIELVETRRIELQAEEERRRNQPDPLEDILPAPQGEP